MLALIFIAMSSGLVALVHQYWTGFDALPVAVSRGSFGRWCLRGILVPFLIISLINTGLVPGLPPVLSRIPIGGAFGWTQAWAFLTQQCLQGFVITSWWSAFTLAWIISLHVRAAEDWTDALTTMISWSLIGLPLGAVFFLLGQWPGLGLALTGWLWPVTHGMLAIMPTRTPQPQYSRVIGHMMLDRPEEAEWEVLKELEQFQDDYEGWMLMAQIYATQYRDVRLAEQTVFELCAQPNVSITQLANALHKLAGWHLDIADDPAGALFALEEIRRRLPDTHLAREAQLRIDRIPKTREELLESRKPRTIRLPQVQTVDQQIEAKWKPDLDPDSAQAMAEDCAASLNREPNDVPTREKLARLYTEHLGRADRGLEQLDLLLALPDQPETKTAAWLALKAHWQEHYSHNPTAARETLQRLVGEYPRSLHAFAAYRRLTLMRKT